MAASPAHRSTHSMGSNNLHTPSPGARPRRLTSPSQTSLGIPEGGPQQFGRPPSPLRNGFIPDTSTGIDPHDLHSDSDSDDDNDDDNNNHAPWGDRSPSPSGSSVSQLAASFAQRVGSLVEGIKSRSQLPTDEELEAEAQRERDRSRREAEAILTREAEQRRLVEERVLAMMDSAKSLPPPPSRSPGHMSNPPSPSASQKEGGGVSWWAAAKNRLTPTKDKEPLTPAQQVIQDAKTREKDQKKSAKGKERASGEWPANPQGKFNDPSFHNLNLPPVSPQRKPVPSSPASPTPSRPNLSNMPPNLTPSPMRSVDNLSVSPSREAPPLYATFNDQGTLDVATTLITISKRFEKLEKWTVGHVRALEERMNDVERWLVDKEREREQKEKTNVSSSTPTATNGEARSELSELRDEISELQGRVGELGREMAKMATSPSNLSSGPSRYSPMINSTSPTHSMIATHAHYSHHSPSASISMSLASTPGHSRLVSSTARESTSPPMNSSGGSNGVTGSSSRSSGTKLPYPTGDYASPNNSFSPPSSPPPSGNSKTRAMSISGLPSSSPNNMATANSITRAVSPTSSLTGSNLNLSLGLGRIASPDASLTSLSKGGGTSPSNLPPPKQSQRRQTSVSPTPRKRYTVALGEPIRSQSPPIGGPLDDVDATPLSKGMNGGGQPISFGRNLNQTSIGTAMFSSSPGGLGFEGMGGGDGEGDGVGGGGDGDMFQDETIGKSAALRLVGSSSSINNKNDTNEDPFSFPSSSSTQKPNTSSSTTNHSNNTNPRPPRSRPRPQSTYTFGSSSTLMSSLNSFNSFNSFDSNTSSGGSAVNPPQANIKPLRPRIRSKSTERFGHVHGGAAAGSMESLSSVSTTSSVSSTSTTSYTGAGGGKFVDPLVLRRQEKEEKDKEEKGRGGVTVGGAGGGGGRGKGKVPVGQLVAFFDEKKKKEKR